VEWNTAHGGASAFGEGDVQDLCATSCIIEEHLVEVTQAEQQESIARQLAFDALVLKHHGCELRLFGHARAR
jgi:hypothetical protein